MKRETHGRQILEQSHAQVYLLLDRLDEQQRRHVSGLLSLMLGNGGDSFLERQFGINRHTTRTGKRELIDGFKGVPTDRIRRPGGGRPSLEKKVPNSKRSLRKSSNRASVVFPQENENGQN
jgi:hypothetical protein